MPPLNARTDAAIEGENVAPSDVAPVVSGTAMPGGAAVISCSSWDEFSGMEIHGEANRPGGGRTRADWAAGRSGRNSDLDGEAAER